MNEVYNLKSLDEFIRDEFNTDSAECLLSTQQNGAFNSTMNVGSDNAESSNLLVGDLSTKQLLGKKSYEDSEKVILKRGKGFSGSDFDDPKQVGEKIFRCFKKKEVDLMSKKEFLSELSSAGILLSDSRLLPTLQVFQKHPSDLVDKLTVIEALQENHRFIRRVLINELAIPEFPHFCQELEHIFHQTQFPNEGELATYIPQLARVDPSKYGVSICTVDGQRWSMGDSNVDFCVQSTCKPVNYALAMDEHGCDYVHNFVGREPSGTSFNAITLSKNGKPHNPLINAGAIMTCSMIKPLMDLADRFDFVTNMWSRLGGGGKPGFSNATYLSERNTADRNFALAYYMRKQNGFPPGTDLTETLEFYFQCCSIEMTCEKMSVVAGTFANGGVCPVTGERVISASTVRNVLSLMYSCGMYDYSGEFSFTIGLPAKSGVAGAVMIVIPNIMGICTWSPRLDKHGNSFRGIEFCKHLCNVFNFHNYDGLINISGLSKRDPRVRGDFHFQHNLVALLFASSQGDLSAIRRLMQAKVNVNTCDYDRRTPLHLACVEGHTHVVAYFIKNGANVNARDRWNATPLDDAVRENRQKCIVLLKANGGLSGSQLDSLSESCVLPAIPSSDSCPQIHPHSALFDDGPPHRWNHE